MASIFVLRSDRRVTMNIGAEIYFLINALSELGKGNKGVVGRENSFRETSPTHILVILYIIPLM